MSLRHTYVPAPIHLIRPNWARTQRRAYPRGALLLPIVGKWLCGRENEMATTQRERWVYDAEDSLVLL